MTTSNYDFVLAIKCPKCDAKPGHLCRTKNRRPVSRNNSHADRWRAAIDEERNRYVDQTSPR